MVHRRFLASSQVALLNVSLPSTEVVRQFVGDYQQTHETVVFDGEKIVLQNCVVD